jgi:heat shock protein HslJ/uncharacterized lipoprotein YbaY
MWRVLIPASLVVMSLVGCTESPDNNEARSVTRVEPAVAATFSGSLSYRQRIALPPSAEVALEISDSASNAVVAEHRFALDGRQAPIAFEIVPKAGVLRVGGGYRLRAAIVIDGEMRWLNAEQPLDATRGDLGEILLEPQEPAFKGADFRCGDTLVRFALGEGDVADMRIGNTAYAMHKAVAASGVKYENPGEPGTFFWRKGDGALVSVDGRTLPECVPAQPPRSAGAQPRGITWRLEDLNRTGIIDRSRITLLLGEDGRASGTAGCNRYTTGYELNGAVLKIDERIASTQMACVAESLMQQEQRYFELLALMHEAKIDETGALILGGSDGVSMKFYPDEDIDRKP